MFVFLVANHIDSEHIYFREHCVKERIFNMFILNNDKYYKYFIYGKRDLVTRHWYGHYSDDPDTVEFKHEVEYGSMLSGNLPPQKKMRI